MGARPRQVAQRSRLRAAIRPVRHQGDLHRHTACRTRGRTPVPPRNLHLSSSQPTLSPTRREKCGLGPQIDAVELGGLDEGIHGGDAATSGIGAREGPVPTTNRDRPASPLGGINGPPRTRTSDARFGLASLKAWAMNVAKRAKVALARKLGIVLHRMWLDETDFRFGRPLQA